MRHVMQIAARLPPGEREGCEAAFLVLSLLRSDYDDFQGHPSLDIEDYIESLRTTKPEVMNDVTASWVRDHVELPKRDALGIATIRTSVGRLACSVDKLRYVNLDEPDSGPFFDSR